MKIDASVQKVALLNDSIRLAQATPTADKPPRWAIGNPRLESAWKQVIEDYHPKNWPAAVAIFKNYCKKHSFPLPIAANEELDIVYA
jgi:hypothetical protein